MKRQPGFAIKKESPNEGTETPPTRRSLIGFVFGAIKKESPNEGTETSYLSSGNGLYPSIKKESPNEGTETPHHLQPNLPPVPRIKKESPNEGTETVFSIRDKLQDSHDKKRIPE